MIKRIIFVNLFPNTDAPKVTYNIPRYLRSCFFISCFTLTLSKQYSRIF